MLHREVLEFTILSPRFKWSPVFSIIRSWIRLITICHYFILLSHKFPSQLRHGEFQWKWREILPRGWSDTGAVAQKGRQELCTSGEFWGSWAVLWAATLTGLGLETSEVPSQHHSAVLHCVEKGKALLKTSLRCYRIDTCYWRSLGFPIPGSLFHLLLNFSDSMHLGWYFPDACRGSFLFLLKAM